MIVFVLQGLSHLKQKKIFFLSIYFLLYKNTLLFLLSFFKIVKNLIQMALKSESHLSKFFLLFASMTVLQK